MSLTASGDNCAPNGSNQKTTSYFSSCLSEVHLGSYRPTNLPNLQNSLGVIVPVFNEEQSVKQSLDSLVAALSHLSPRVTVVVINDGSRDTTGAVLERYAVQPHSCFLHILSHPTNRGKGAAIRTALSFLNVDWVIIQDADLEYNPDDILRLYDIAIRGETDVVYGSRYLHRPNFSFGLFSLGVKLLNVLVKLWYGVTITDEATCYKLFRLRDLEKMQLTCTSFEFCPEVTAKACRLGLNITEAPVAYNPRSRSEGKKIRLKDGWVAIRTLWRLRHWRPDPYYERETL